LLCAPFRARAIWLDPEANVYKILFYFGSLQLNPLYLVMVIASLLLLALAQSYASAKRMSLRWALILSLVVLVAGDFITYFLFVIFFKEYNDPNYIFQHVSIYSYGFMLMVAFVVGTIWLVVQGKREKPPIEIDTILDLMVWVIIGSIIGARAIYVATQWQDYVGQKENILRITEGGLSIHGGILGAMIFGWFYCRAKGLDYWKMADFVFPGVPLGMFFGRIGCFLNGCCYGIKCAPDFPLGVKFPNAETWMQRGYSSDLAALYDAGQAALDQYARHPAQLYEAFGALAIFWYLINFRQNKVFKGHVFLMFVWLYSVLRFIVEFYRFGDPETGKGSSIVLWHLITMAQLASLILGIAAFFLMQELKRRTVLAKMLAEGGEARKAAPEPEVEEEEELVEEEAVVEEEEAGEDSLIDTGEQPPAEEKGPEFQ
jgi:phosphatidylglycerol:prolipoprotein diacylglycerol transferase